MNKETIAATDFKKPYAKPLMTVVEIGRADIICTSGTTEGYGDGDTSGWYLPS